jgi:hypothetical protein
MDLCNACAAEILFEQGSFVLSIAGADGADGDQVRVYLIQRRSLGAPSSISQAPPRNRRKKLAMHIRKSSTNGETIYT